MSEQHTKKFTLVNFLFFTFTFVFTLIIGSCLGLGISQVQNIGIIQRQSRDTFALPTKILDRNNKLITSFFSSENRTLLQFKEIPRLLMMALITREDQSFLEHRGFSFRGTSRAVWNLITNNYVSGGSTLSQQVAGMLYADRREFSIIRKLRELWWSLNIERSWSKQEIVAEYLNKVYFGHGNYGAETASQYYFGHGPDNLNYAEAVMLVIQLANPVKYSPFKNPNVARERQKTILDQMVAFNYISAEQANNEFLEYWNNYDFTRAGTSSAFLERDDKAPHFSEYIRYLLLNELNFTNEEINTGGLTIYTTLDLDMQELANTYFNEGLSKANRIYQSNQTRKNTRESNIYPLASLATLFFDNTNQLFSKKDLQLKDAVNYFNSNLQPSVALIHLMFGRSPNSLAARIAYESQNYYKLTNEEETVEGALVSLDNSNGHIVALIGGSRFDATNQFNRAINAFVQPGSAFKPLYYAAAFEEKIITPSTIIWDSPVVFTTEDGDLYVPTNYKGEWKGPVSVREALSNSMNVPSLKVLNMVGFDKALEISSKLLNLPKSQWDRVGLVPKYPIGLGIISIPPISMAQAYATIANSGRRVTPVAIRYITNREGEIISQPEKDIQNKNKFNSMQIISPQTAYIMTSLLQSTVNVGTLSYAQGRTGGFTQPTAGKTGTTQNWSDSWTIGYTPYFTTAVWFGFDRGGQSLGTNQTGALTTGPVWAQFMEAINKDLPVKDFVKPQGIIAININPDNNKRAVSSSTHVKTEIFIAGTEPTEYDTFDEEKLQHSMFVDQLENYNWDLKLPSNNTVNEDAYFDYLSQGELSQKANASDDTNTKPDISNKSNNSLSLRLEVPSVYKLRRSTPNVNTILDDSQNTDANTNNNATVKKATQANDKLPDKDSEKTTEKVQDNNNKSNESNPNSDLAPQEDNGSTPPNEASSTNVTNPLLD